MVSTTLVFTACFIDVGGGSSAPSSDSTASPATDTQPTTSGTAPGSTSASTGSDATTAGAATGPETTAVDTTTGPDPTAVDTTASTNVTVNTNSDPSSETMTTAGEPDPLCGNGMVESGEDCDDGNAVDDDDCRNDCTLTACYDNVQNGDETDVDCGGEFCGPCGVCEGCTGGLDCEGLLTCERGRCNRTFMIDINWGVDCGADYTNFQPIATEYSGDWEITALYGGGYLQPGNPQEYGWIAHCDGFDFGGLQADFIYSSTQEAFDSIDPKVVVSGYAGGPTKCGVFDDDCFNNFGSSNFSLRPLCD